MKKFSTAPVVALGAALAAGSAGTNADAASLDSVLSLIASTTGQLGSLAEFSFNLDASNTIVQIDQIGGSNPLAVDAGDVITTFFDFTSVTSSNGGVTSTVFLDTTLNGPAAGQPAGIFNSTVGVFGSAEFLVTETSLTTITVTGNPAEEPLFRVFEDNNPSFLVISDLPNEDDLRGASLFANIGLNTATDPFVFTVGNVETTDGDLNGLDIANFDGADSLIAFLGDSLIPESAVTISASQNSASGTVTISAVVVPSPAAAGVGVLGVLGLLGARRRRPTQVA